MVSRDEAPVGGLGEISPQKLKLFADIVNLQISTAETIKIWEFTQNSVTPILDQSVSQWGGGANR